ncbi:hypothetical protein ACFYPC_23860 [Streptomyces sp. NPDC005808]|uniref:hypothetical protein n=1 Tax=Streptomyces sp. NPDC005808 TaxID=3364734 RepID=UPI00369F47E8
MAVTGVWLFSAQVMVYATSNSLYRDSERATGLGWVTGVGRAGAVVGPSLVGTLASNGSESWGFIAFALAGVTGAVAIALVPAAGRLGNRARTGSVPM